MSRSIGFARRISALRLSTLRISVLRLSALPGAALRLGSPTATLAAMAVCAIACAPLASSPPRSQSEKPHESDVPRLMSQLLHQVEDQRASSAGPEAEDEAASSVRPDSEAVLSLEVTQVPVPVFFRALSSLIGTDIALEDRLTGQVSLRLQQVPWMRAAQLAASQLGLYADFSPLDRLVRVQARPCAPAQCGVQKTYSLRYAEAQAMAALLRQSAQALGSSLTVSAEKTTNTLVLSGDESAVNRSLLLADRLDGQRAVILVEMWILETSDERSRLLGLDLGLNDEGGRWEGGVPPDSSGFNLLRQSPPGAQAALTGRFNRQRLLLRLAALEQDGFTRILSNPRIYVVDGEQAEVFQGDEVPYTVRTENGGVHTEFRQAGLRLEVLPRTLADGDISLQLYISKDTVDRSRASPPISRREMRTRLVLRPGSVAIIGGIRSDGESGRRSGVPFGALAGGGEGQSGSTRLLVVLSAAQARP